MSETGRPDRKALTETKSRSHSLIANPAFCQLVFSTRLPADGVKVGGPSSLGVEPRERFRVPAEVCGPRVYSLKRNPALTGTLFESHLVHRPAPETGDHASSSRRDWGRPARLPPPPGPMVSDSREDSERDPRTRHESLPPLSCEWPRPLPARTRRGGC